MTMEFVSQNNWKFFNVFSFILKPWAENTLHSTVLAPPLERDRYTWAKRNVDFDIWSYPNPEFNPQDPITIQLAGEKLLQEKLDAKKVDQDSVRIMWRFCYLYTANIVFIYLVFPEWLVYILPIFSGNQRLWWMIRLCISGAARQKLSWKNEDLNRVINWRD